MPANQEQRNIDEAVKKTIATLYNVDGTTSKQVMRAIGILRQLINESGERIWTTQEIFDIIAPAHEEALDQHTTEAVIRELEIVHTAFNDPNENDSDKALRFGKAALEERLAELNQYKSPQGGESHEA